MDENVPVQNIPVRAKFRCDSETKTRGAADGCLYSYKFSAVTSGSEENKAFWKWTPSGFIELSSIRNDLFEVGKEYYLDFSIAEYVKELSKGES